MSCHTIRGGFNPRWSAGRLENELVDSLAQQLTNQYPNQITAIAVPSWHEPTLIVKQLQTINPTVTLLCSFTDPLGPIEHMIDQIPGQVHLVGYVDRVHRYDFWAIACLKFFKHYNLEDLVPEKFNFLYLNYNRKPHRHRVDLIRQLEIENLISVGCNTLGNSSYTVGDQDSDYLTYGAKDIVGDVGIPNDIYSLGRLDIWNRSFINIVGETQYEYSPHVFVSEKIFKPIIGLRPFVINGTPGIYNWLQTAGFDCFEDLFPVEKLKKMDAPHGCKFPNHDLICNSLKRYIGTDLIKLFDQLTPRLIANRELFYHYARNQQFNFHFSL